MKMVAKLFISSLAFFASLFLAEILLGLFGFPLDREETYAYRPYDRRVEKNMEFNYFFETNSQGLRYREIPFSKPGRTFRIFVVGDSFVEGYGATTENRFTNILEHKFSTRLHKVEFVNGGLDGAGPLQYGRLLFHIGRKYQLDGLLICVFANDVVDTPATASPDDLYSKVTVRRRGLNNIIYKLWPRSYTLASNVYRWRNYVKRTRPSDLLAAVSDRALEVGIPQEQIDVWKSRLPAGLVAAANRGAFGGYVFALGLLHPAFWTESIDIDTVKANAKWQAMVAILTEIANLSRREGLQVGVTFIPSLVQYDSTRFSEHHPLRQAGIRLRQEWLWSKSELQKRLDIWARREGLPFLDLTPMLREKVRKGQRLTYALDGHWNAEGHRVAATAIADWIEKKHVFTFIAPKKNESEAPLAAGSR